MVKLQNVEDKIFEMENVIVKNEKEFSWLSEGERAREKERGG